MEKSTLQIITAIVLGMAVWIALHMFCFFRKEGHRDVTKYIQGFHRADFYVAYLIAAGGMSLCYGMAVYYGLPFINCIRNELVFAWLFVIAMIDGKEQVIPKALTTAGFGGWVLLAIISVLAGGSCKGVLFFSGSGLLLGGGVFLLCRVLTKGGIGMGDIRMFSVLGLLYGMNYTFSILFFTILFLSIFGIAATLMKKKNMKSMIAMGPFTLAAYLCSCLLGV